MKKRKIRLKPESYRKIFIKVMREESFKKLVLLKQRVETVGSKIVVIEEELLTSPQPKEIKEKEDKT